MRFPTAALRVLWVLATVGCAQQYDNPFAGRSRTIAPPDSASLLFTSSQWASNPGAGREVYAVNPDGSGVTRLTYCNTDFSACDNLDVAPSPDRKKIVVRRVTDTDPSEAIVYVDLARGVETTIVASSRRVSSIEWSPLGDYIFYTGLGAGGRDDLYRVDYNGQNDVNVSSTTDTSERHPRVDPFGVQITFGATDQSGLGLVYIISSSGVLAAVTAGGTPAPPLAGHPWVVGSDADPAYSPAADSLAFRRCTGPGTGGRGIWDILAIDEVLGAPSVVAAGPAYRSEPDWGSDGIAFWEEARDEGITRLVVLNPDGTNRRVLFTQGSSFAFGAPRFLRSR